MRRSLRSMMADIRRDHPPVVMPDNSYVSPTGFKRPRKLVYNYGGPRRPVALNNTLEYWLGDKRIIRLHATDIMVFHADGSITIDANGWHTVTTRDRVNEFLPSGWSVRQRKWQWFITTPVIGEIPFRDGMTFDREGRLIG